MGWETDKDEAVKAVKEAKTVAEVEAAVPWPAGREDHYENAFIGQYGTEDQGGSGASFYGSDAAALKAAKKEALVGLAEDDGDRGLEQYFFNTDWSKSASTYRTVVYQDTPPMTLDSSIKETSIDSAWDLESQYRHQPSEVFSKLSNQRIDMNFSPQPGPPISGENAFLRTLSPFTIRLLPPEDMTEQPSAETGVTTNYAIAQAAANATGFSAHDTGSESLANVQAATAGMVTTGAMNTRKAGLLTTHDLASIYSQVAAMAMTPPLVLLINPSSMNIQYQKHQQFQQRTRNGYIFQSWGEQQPTISFSGRIGAFYASESLSESRAWANFGYTSWGIFQGGYGETSTSTGVQEASRRDSSSFQNLMGLFQVYRNNAYVRDGVSGSGANHMIGMVCIEYDQWAYYGHFGKFDFSFTQETNLGGINYSFDFTCSRIEDRASSSYYVRPLESPLNVQSGGSMLDAAGNTDPVAAALAGNQGDMEEPRWMREGFTWPAYVMTNQTETVVGYGSESWDSKMGGKGWEGTGLPGKTEWDADEMDEPVPDTEPVSYSDDEAGDSAQSVDAVLALAATLGIDDTETLEEITALLEILASQQQIISELPNPPETLEDLAAAETATRAAVAAIDQLIAIIYTLDPDLSLLERSQMVSKLVKARNDLLVYWEAVNPGAATATVDPPGWPGVDF